MNRKCLFHPIMITGYVTPHTISNFFFVITCLSLYLYNFLTTKEARRRERRRKTLYFRPTNVKLEKAREIPHDSKFK